MSALGVSFLVATALILGFRRIGQSAIVACIVGGMLLKLVAAQVPPPHMDTLHDLQGLGIMLLLVMAGMQVEVDRLLRDWRTMLLALGQVAIGWILGAGLCLLGLALGWLRVDTQSGVALFGLCLTLSSTAIVLENLRARGAAHTPFGQAVLALMLFQDIVAVASLSLMGLPGEGGEKPIHVEPLQLGVQFIVSAALAIVIGRTLLTRIIERVRYDEGLLLIFVLGWAVGLGGLAYQNGFSPTIAAFLAGVALSFTPHKATIELRIEPLKVFGVTIYFISLGLTLPLEHIQWQLIWPVGLATFLIVAIRPWTSAMLARRARMGRKDAGRFGLVIGQGSEFAIILAVSALHAEVFDERAFLVIVLTCLVSMVVSPWLQVWSRRHYRAGTSGTISSSQDTSESIAEIRP